MYNRTPKQVGLVGLFLLVLLLTVGWGNQPHVAADDSTKINTEIQVEPALLAEMAENGRAGYLIYFKEKADLSPAYNMDWEARGHYVVKALQEAAEASQKNVRAYLDNAGVRYNHFWIDNIVIVESSDLTVLNGLLAFNEIASIRAEVENVLIEPEAAVKTGTEPAPNAVLAPEPNLVRVKATDTWALGFRGQGMVIANIDSGVRHTHNALVNQYRGNLGGGTFNHNYNWLDPDAATTAPVDTNGHGTHVMGTMVGYDGGANEIGVAPEAEWIACRGCLTNSCSSNALLTCAQWVAAPYPIGDPGSPDPNMRPLAVNNSWGSCQQSYDPWYQGVVDAWHAGGVYPIFANGNASNCGYSSPPGLNTVGNPGRYGNVTGVGSSGTSNGLYAPHSNWGPTDNLDTVNPQTGWADLKPQVIAPGVSIRSSVPSSDGAYESSGWTGTSMSAPHVTGMLALMIQAAPCLAGDYATLETIIEQTATPIFYNDGVGGGPRWPNYASGWGEIDVLAAVTMASGYCGPTGTLTGEVTADGTGNPLPGANVLVTISITQTKSATANASGTYTITYVPEGSYDVTASIFGYLPQTINNVNIVSGTVTVQDFELVQAPSHTVSGVVTDNTTGWPLYASIEINGADIDPIWTDPVDGSYSVVLPEGITYTFNVNAWVAGYETASRDVGPLTGNVTENFGLDADLLTCNAPGYSLSYIYYEDFEANNGGYTLSGANPAPWQWGTPSTWPGNCGEGTSCWGTNLTGNYSNSANQTLTSPSLDLSAVVTGTQVFARWHQANHIEHFQWDKVYAEVSINGGPWTIMWQNPPSPTVVQGWRELSYDVSAAAGTNAQLRWRFTSDSSVNFPGLYIDRVTLAEANSCTPAAGGLVVGNVYDGNTNEPLIGALVTGDDDSMVTVAVPADPNVDDGFYTIFAAAGSSDVTASYSGYADDTANLTIADGTTTEQNFWLAAGWITANPTAIEMTLEYGDTATVPLTLTNGGDAPAAYTLTVTALAEDFEGTFAPDGWTVINNGGTCVWQRNDQVPSGRPNYAGGLGFSAAADSDRCGTGTTMNTELRTPVLDLSGATVASLDFVASYRHLGSSSFRVHASDDGGANWDTLLTWSADSSPTGPGTPVSLNLTPYVGSNNVIVSFHYVAPSWDWWAQVDQIRLTSDVGPWLALDPAVGNIGDNSDVVVDVTLDTNGVPAPGVYTTMIQVDEDTPYALPAIPVTLTVTASPDLALLDGTVQSLGYCDTNPAPANGAEVVITSGANTWTVYTDANGYYSQYINQSFSPVDIAVTAPNHEAGSATGVVLVGQQTTTEDFDLRLIVPCVSVDPELFDVELGLGAVVTYTLNIINNGGGTTPFELRELDGGYTPAFLSLGASNAQDEPLSIPYLSTAEISEVGIASEVPVIVPTASGTAPEDITEWETMAALPAGRVFSAVVADENGYVYVIGGTSDGAATTPTNTTYRYNTTTNTWDTMATLPVALDSIDGIVINNKIYIPGSASTATTYVYDIATDTWATIAASGGYTARSQYQVAAIGNDLYVLGGIVAAASASTPEVWKLDTVAQTWTASTSMQQTRTSFAAGSIDGELYVAGGVAFPGFTPTMTAEKFDGVAWSYIANVPNGGGAYTRWSYNADAVGPQGLWLAGGRRDAGWAVLDNAGYYDPTTNTWVDSPTIPALSQARVYMEGDVASDGYFYVIGGRDGAGAIAYATNERLYVGVPTSSDVPWLATNPVTGTVGADSSTAVSVIFDTTVLTQTGVYNAILRVLTNDSGGAINVPITLTVAAPAPAITLDVTVSTADECGTADDLTVLEGTVVYYCYTVENTGNVMLPSHTISDTVFGHLTTFTYDLMPGESESVIISQTITADTTSTATWHASHSGLDMSAMADDTVTITTTPNVTYGVELHAATTALTGTAGTTVTYTVHITNTGNMTDTFDLALSGNGWTTNVQVSIEVGAGQMAMFYVTVQIPAGADDGDTDTVTVTATSDGDDTESDSVTLTTTAEVEPVEPPTPTIYLPLIFR